jgi:hypothetical protein
MAFSQLSDKVNRVLRIAWQSCTSQRLAPFGQITWRFVTETKENAEQPI